MTRLKYAITVLGFVSFLLPMAFSSSVAAKEEKQCGWIFSNPGLYTITNKNGTWNINQLGNNRNVNAPDKVDYFYFEAVGHPQYYYCGCIAGIYNKSNATNDEHKTVTTTQNFDQLPPSVCLDQKLPFPIGARNNLAVIVPLGQK